jgi:hypothetical protein
MTASARYRDWKIRSGPSVTEAKFRSTVVVEETRNRTDEPVRRFLFPNLGEFDSAAAADAHAIEWARHWIDQNFVA